MRRELEGWRSTQARGAHGVVHSDERVRARHTVVAHSSAGGLHLGDRYWSEVGRASRGALQLRENAGGVELRLRLALPLLYDRLQHRLHVRISRRYFRRLIAEAAG